MISLKYESDSFHVKTINNEINILRGIAFFLVLFGHSFPDSAYGYINAYTEFAREFIYSFHMPLFFIISGFCMAPLLSEKQVSIKAELIKRCKRLLIPYLFYSYIAIIPKLIFSSYMYIEFEPKVIWTTLLGKSTSGTLWYLWNLFMINMLFLLISRLTSSRRLWLLISFGLYAINLFFQLSYFDKVMEYSVFYVLGIFLSTYFTAVKKWIENKGILMLIFMLIDAGIVIFIGNNQNIKLLTALIGSIPMLYIAIQIQTQGGIFKNILELASDYSYGIYLMSPYIQVAIRVFLYKKLGVSYILCMGLMFVLGFLFPYVVIKYIVEKNKYLSRILIGQW